MILGGATLFGRRRPSRSVNFLTEDSLRRFSASPSEHITFIKDVAATCHPENLPYLLNMLQKRGDAIVLPGDKQGLMPLTIPLSKNSSGVTMGLLRWPTAPVGMEMPVVEIHKHGVWPLAKNVDQYIHRILVEEDANSPEDSNRELFHASADAGKKFYKQGKFAESEMPNVDTYLLRKVGLFPDVVERKIKQYLEKGNEVSALVTIEYYAKKEHFPGFGRPFAFNADILLRIGRDLEAKDAARGALKAPWWTLGYKYQEVAEMAQWKDEQIYYIKKKLSEEGKQEDLNKGKELAQIALDEAAFLLDLASIEGNWDDYMSRVAECYKEGGLHDIARFISFSG